MRNLYYWLLTTFMALLVAAPSLAMIDKNGAEGAGNSIGAAIPEPRALLLFAVGTLLVAWASRRRGATS